jgi:hypothetical protein
MTILEQQALGRALRVQKRILINSVYGGSSIKYPSSATIIFSKKRYMRKLKLEELFPEFKKCKQFK